MEGTKRLTQKGKESTTPVRGISDNNIKTTTMMAKTWKNIFAFVSEFMTPVLRTYGNAEYNESALIDCATFAQDMANNCESNYIWAVSKVGTLTEYISEIDEENRNIMLDNEKKNFFIHIEGGEIEAIEFSKKEVDAINKNIVEFWKKRG